MECENFHFLVIVEQSFEIGKVNEPCRYLREEHLRDRESSKYKHLETNLVDIVQRIAKRVRCGWNSEQGGRIDEVRLSDRIMFCSLYKNFDFSSKRNEKSRVVSRKVIFMSLLEGHWLVLCDSGPGAETDKLGGCWRSER